LTTSRTPVGASGAIAGVLGAYLVLHPRVKVLVLVLLFRRVPLVLPAYLLIGTWLLLQLFNLWSGNSAPVAWWAHIGGFIAGRCLSYPFATSRSPCLTKVGPLNGIACPPPNRKGDEKSFALFRLSSREGQSACTLRPHWRRGSRKDEDARRRIASTAI